MVEPQPRKCYITARQRLRKRRLDFPAFLDEIDTKSLEPDNLIIAMLAGTGVTEHTVLGTESWGRSLISFHKSVAT